MEEAKPEDDSARFIEQGLDELESPFTRETVLELNAIVSRSLVTVRGFDEIRLGLDSGDDVSVEEALARYHTLSGDAAAARADMDAAVDRLERSGERYNASILAAMVNFVNKVDDEIRAEIATLRGGERGGG